MQTSELRFWYNRPEIEPTVEFEYPPDPMPDQVKDWFKKKYGGNLDDADAQWLGEAFDDFLATVNPPAVNAEYRLLAKCFVNILFSIDDEVSRSSHPDRKWKKIAAGLGLPSKSFRNLQH